MKCQNLFSGKNIINLSSAEFAHRMVKVKSIWHFPVRNDIFS